MTILCCSIVRRRLDYDVAMTRSHCAFQMFIVHIGIMNESLLSSTVKVRWVGMRIQMRPIGQTASRTELTYSRFGHVGIAIRATHQITVEQAYKPLAVILSTLHFPTAKQRGNERRKRGKEGITDDLKSRKSIRNKKSNNEQKNDAMGDL